MGTAFLTKRKDLLKRASAYEESKWKMLEVRHTKVRLVGLYATQSASAQDWLYINAALKILRVKRGSYIVCGDLNVSHTSYGPSGKKRGGNALEALKKPLQRQDPRTAD